MAAAKRKTAAKAPAKRKQYDDSNTGVLFVNDKEGNEMRPDWTGNVKIRPEDYEAGEDGLVEIRLAAWAKNSDRVGDYLSLKASAPQA